MIEVKLDFALSEYTERTGVSMTHAELAEQAGISKSTVDSLAARKEYNATLRTIDRICTVLECDIAVLLQHHPDRPGPGTEDS